LTPDVRKWEDRRALIAEDNGTLFHKKLIEMYDVVSKNQFLKGLPRVVMELDGEHQRPDLENYLGKKKIDKYEFFTDTARNTRTLRLY
jgi:release factor glutamine methyltransferase